MVRDTGELPRLAHLVGGKEPFLKVVGGAVELNCAHLAGDALEEGAVVLPFGVGVGG
jgi:hypothetical protein